MDNNLRREIILDNYQNPINNEIIDNEKYQKINTSNESCIDNIDIYVLVEENIIKDIKFHGEACAISTASTSIMTKLLIGKSFSQANEIISSFENMINEKEYNENLLGEALAFNEIYKQNNRKNCALLPYKGIKKIIKEQLN